MKNKSLHNEPELLEQLYDGSQEAFTILYHEYSERLYYNILSMVKDEHTAEELVQDIFAHIWNKRGSVRIKTTFGNYMFTVSRNRVYDFFRGLERESNLYERIKELATEHYSHIEEAMFARENKELLDRAIASLSPQRRKVFELCKIEGLSYKEAAEQLGLSISTIKDHMAKARDDLRAYISGNPSIFIGIVFFCFCNNP